MSLMPPLPKFDVLVALNARDPAAFDAFRSQLLQSAMEMAPQEHRPALKALIGRMEAVRAEARTPLEAAAGASRLMLESSSAMRDAMGCLLEKAAALQTDVLLTKFRL